ncbi:hypothetical protein JF535_04810 [Microbulbifer salipaludis]|uniref:Uncharacterized protein n=1 Tax=Microbulbifer salipaludis TaxID=187980 RepID=A0ABS3E4E3_9GAMM|nr:hypothetical protein [Microbulbifer salipaludis]MBN8430171.1 hypothetical protein [Microbulbifer salipaludis]
MNNIITIAFISVIAIGAITWRKKSNVRRYIRSNLPSLWDELGMTDGLDVNEIKKEDAFYKYISSKSFVHVDDPEFCKVCLSYIKWGRFFVACCVAWLVLPLLAALG